MTSFIFVRHGESEANRESRLGEVGSKLTEKGIEQAHATGQALKDKGIQIIVCSEFLRAQQTAEIIAGELGIAVANIKVIANLAERRMGKYEGLKKDHSTDWYYSTAAVNPEFEPHEQLLTRMHKALLEVGELCKEGKVLVVGHALSGLYLIEASKGTKHAKDVPQGMPMENASYIEIKVP